MTFFVPNSNPSDSVPRPYETLRAALIRRNEAAFPHAGNNWSLNANEGPGIGTAQVPSTHNAVFWVGLCESTNDNFVVSGNRFGNNTGHRLALRQASGDNFTLRSQFRAVPAANLTQDFVFPNNSAIVATFVSSSTASAVKLYINGSIATNYGGASSVQSTSQLALWRFLSEGNAFDKTVGVILTEVVPSVVPEAEIVAYQQAVIGGRRLYLRPDAPRLDCQRLPTGPVSTSPLQSVAVNGFPPPVNFGTEPIEVVDLTNLVWPAVS